MRIEQLVKIGFVTLVSAIYLIMIFTITSYGLTHALASKLYSNQDIEESVQKEKVVLGLIDKISFEIVDNQKGWACRTTQLLHADGDYSYHIEFTKSYTDTACVKHELYHIYRHAPMEFLHYNRIIFTLADFIYMEPSAQLYVLFGIKL